MVAHKTRSASLEYYSPTSAGDDYVDMPPLVTADGAIVVEQDNTSTPRATLDIIAGINRHKGPEQHLNAKSLAELNTSNIKVDIEELSQLSEDEEVLTPPASEFDAVTIAEINAVDIIDDLIPHGVDAIGEGITEEGLVASGALLTPPESKTGCAVNSGAQALGASGTGAKNESDKGFETKGNGTKKVEAVNDAHIKAMAHKYAYIRASMDKAYEKVEHKEKGRLEARHDGVNGSMYKQIEKVEQKRKSLYKKLAEVQAKHAKVVEEKASWMTKNKEREEAVQGKKKKIGLPFLPSEK